jgi:hypothetical protein
MNIFLTVLAVIAGATALFFGAGAFIATLILGVLAIVLSVKKKKEGKGGVVCIVFAVLAIACSGLVTAGYTAAVPTIKEKAQENNLVNLEKYADKLTFGPVGMVVSAKADGVDAQTLTNELSIVAKNSGTTGTSNNSKTSE